MLKNIWKRYFRLFKMYLLYIYIVFIYWNYFIWNEWMKTCLYSERFVPEILLTASEFMVVFGSSRALSGLWAPQSAAMMTFDRRSALNLFFLLTKARTNCRRCPQITPPPGRGQCTAANHTPGPGEKPRLRAVDLAQKVRDEKAKAQATEPPMSAQQRRVMDLKRFTMQLQKVHPNVLAKHLHKSVLYQDKDVVVLNKPYGVPVAGKTA